MRILALEPYLGGSHQAFLDGWSRHSGHQWTVLGLPAYKWKWRMRHAAITFCEQLAERSRGPTASWDMLVCSDMLNLAEFRGLVTADLARLPAVIYFHENQLTYPAREAAERDYHFAFSNFTSALAADSVWFNSEFHRQDFLEELDRLLRRMPDHQPLAPLQRLVDTAIVCPPGIGAPPPREPRRPGALRILWAARWEHDKNPAGLFDALSELQRRGVPFRLNVAGEQFRDAPDVFRHARQALDQVIDHWGYVPHRNQYLRLLSDCDVFVSTARHEFFGLSTVEAVAAGCYPLLPQRLSYPEVLGALDSSESGRRSQSLFFYDDSSDSSSGSGNGRSLVANLAELAERVDDHQWWSHQITFARGLVRKFHWDVVAPRLDQQLDQVVRGHCSWRAGPAP